MYSRRDDVVLPTPGFPIRKSPDQSLLSGSPRLIAASHVLHRLLAPRHSPCALSSLTIMQELSCACTRRLPVHYSVVKEPRRRSSVLFVRVESKPEAYFPKGPLLEIP